MEARQLIGGAAFSLGELNVIYRAFNDGLRRGRTGCKYPCKRRRNGAAEPCDHCAEPREVGAIECDSLRAAAVDAFRRKHRIRD
jgi:hypothetical protein